MLDGVYFAGLHRLLLLPLFVVVVACLLWHYYRIKQAVKLLAHPQHFTNLFRHFSLRRHAVKLMLLLGALTCIVIAMLQPQWGKKEELIAQEGRDLLIVLDVSRSMRAQDMKPSRLAFAKLKIERLLTKLTFERVGLLLFSGSSFVACPLTTDYNAFLLFLRNVDTETISSGTTAIDAALNKAIALFSRARERKNKLVLLLADGEDFSLNLSQAQQEVASQGVTICALGIGSPEGAPVPIVDRAGNQQGHEVDEQGRPVLTKLNEELLQKISQKLGGMYLRATYDESDIDHVVSFINRFEKERFEDKKMTKYEERYPWFFTVALFLLTLEWIL